MAFLDDQKIAYEAQITALNAAITALTAANGIESYTLDSGQTVRTVKRSNVGDLISSRDSLLTQYQVLCNRLSPRPTIATPCF